MFGLSSTHAAHTLVLALRLMRLISCGCKRPTFPLHSGMLLRWVHLLRHILAACPVTRVCLQPLLQCCSAYISALAVYMSPTPAAVACYEQVSR